MFTARGSIWACWWIAFGVVAGVGLRSADGGEPDAVERALARGEAVFSGRMTYSVASGKSGSGGVPDRYDFTFSGASWKKVWARDAGTVPRSFSKGVLPPGVDPKAVPPLSGLQELTRVCHRGRMVEYQSVPQDDGKVRKTARVGAGGTVMREEFPPLPQYVGTFWLAETQKYVAENRARGKLKGNDKIGGQDVVVYEWTVPASDISAAFRSFNDQTKDGGLLRAYIAPTLGYAVPRIEHVGVSGKVGAVFEASDFVQYNGIHFPRSARLQYVGPDGPTFAIDYKIERVAAVNEAIPDAEFVVLLPVGTEVADARDGKQSIIFEVTDPGSIPASLGDVMQVERPTAWVRNWKAAVGIGVALGVVALAALFAVLRARGRST